MYSHAYKLVVMLKRPQGCHKKPTNISSNCKAKQWAAGLETEVVNCGISGPGMCMIKVNLP